MTILWFDTETYNDKPISHGTYAYTETCECMLATFAVDDGPVHVVDFTKGETSLYLTELLEDPDVEIIAHNAMFDRNVVRFALGVETDIKRWRCSMVKAMAHALPGGLDKLCDILGVNSELAKHKNGRELVLLFCKPRPKTFKGPRRATHETHPEKWSEFVAYAKADIDAMREVWRKLPAWNYKEQELALWHLDQLINDRGAAVDLDLVEAALAAVDDEQEELRDQIYDATDGDVTSATKRDQLLTHIVESYGVTLPDLKKSTLERRLEDPDLPESVKELIRIRLQAGMASTSKYKALKNGTTRGRIRGTIQFDGAKRTRRAAGRTFQPQNLPSRGLLPPEEITVGIDLLKLGAADMVFSNVMKLTSSTIRGCIVAPPGKKLVVSDLSNIEGRVLAWIAGETWKAQAFRDFDSGHGHDLYKLAYAKSFLVTPESVTKPQRSIGKVQELMLGYQGGVGAFVTGAATYGIDLEEMAEGAYNNIPSDIMDEAEGFYEWALKKNIPLFGLSRRAFTVCDSFKRAWRYSNSNIEALWHDVEDACRMAIRQPGTLHRIQALTIRRDGMWLRIRLPSGRFICYPSPQVDDKGGISYMGENQYTRKWERIKTHGGKLVENIVQSASRDVLFDTMPHIEAAGYAIVLHVHDEVVTECPDSDEFSAEGLSALLSAGHDWTEGLPLAAAGFEDYRYRKD